MLFLSHSWGPDLEGRDNHDRIGEICKALRQRGKKVWFDETEIVGSVSEAMVKGLDDSELVVVFVTKSYMDKVNRMDGNSCYKEFAYSVAKKGNRAMLPVVMETYMLDQTRNWTGKFFMEIGDQLYFNFVSDDGFQEKVDRLVEVIDKKLDALRSGKDDECIDGLEENVLTVDFDPFATALYKVKEFAPGTREWMFARVSAWYHEKRRWTRVFVLMGSAGVGKSVFAAELCRRGGILPNLGSNGQNQKRRSKRLSLGSLRDSLKRRSGGNRYGENIRVGAMHFFKHDDDRTSNPLLCLVSLSNQLKTSVKGFHVNGSIDPKKEDLKTVFRKLISEPCSKIKAPSKDRIIVVLDALDECSPAQRKALLNLLQQCWIKETPDWLGLFLTTRPEDYIPHKLKQFHPTELNTEDEKNQDDIEMYFKHVLKNVVEPGDLDRSVKLLLDRSQGLFLYARFLEDMLATRGSGVLLTFNDIADQDQFPDGLDGVYAQYFERFLQQGLDGDVELYRIIIGSIVVAREPLPISVLHGIIKDNIPSFSKAGKRAIQGLILKAKQLLFVTDDHIRFIHKSMNDWLIDPENMEEDLVVDVVSAHEALGAWCRSMTTETFAFAHALYHLHKAERHMEGAKLLLSLEWLFEAIGRVPIHRFVHDAEEHVVPKKENDHELFRDALIVVRALEKSIDGLLEDRDQLASQLYARIDDTHPIIQQLNRSSMLARKTWLKPLTRSLESADSTLRKILRGHVRSNVRCDVYKNFLLSFANDSFVQVWDLSTGMLIQRFAVQGEKNRYGVHGGGVACGAISEKYFAFGLWDSTILIFSIDTWSQLVNLEPGAIGTLMKFAPNGKHVYVACNNHTIKLVNIGDPSEPLGLLLSLSGGHTEQINGLAICEHEGGDIVVSGAHDIVVWDLGMKKPLMILEPGHVSQVTDLTFCKQPIHRGEKVLVSSSQDGVIRAWFLPSGNPFCSFDTRQEITSLAISNHGENLYVGHGNKFSVYRFEQNVTAEPLKTVFGHSDIIRSIVANEDGFVVTSGDDNTIRVFLFPILYEKQENPTNKIQGHTQFVSAVRFSPCGEYVVTGSRDKSICVWESKTGQLVHQIDMAHESNVCSLDVTEELILSGGGFPDNNVVVFNRKKGYELCKTFKGHENSVYGVIFDNEKMYSCSEDETVRIWDFGTGALLHIVHHSGPVNYISYSTKHKMLVSGSSDSYVYLINRDGKFLGEFYAPNYNKEEDETEGSSNQRAQTSSRKTVRSVSIMGDEILFITSARAATFISVGTKKHLRTIPFPKAQRTSAMFFQKSNENLLLDSNHVRFSNPSLGVGFTTDAAIMAVDLSPNKKQIVLGDCLGGVHLLTMNN